ncbi:MAG: glycosyltransferase family 39 protein [bacterium]|nr:glycosyltransferase family 39 protein [bacterium]
MSNPRREAAVLSILTAAALGLRLVHLTRSQLWVDEAATWWFARLTASGRLAEQIALEPTPPLYYGLIGLLMRLFGESDLVMRLPSALIGAATVPAVFLLGRELFGRRVGWIAALLLSFHPLHVFYSREARVYPLLLLLTIVLLRVLWRALDDDRRRSWAAFGGVLLVTCYSHFYGLFLGAAAGGLIVFQGRSARARRRGLAVAALVGLAFAPYLVLTLPHLRQSGAAWSVETFYTDLPEEKRFGRVLEMALVGADYHRYMRQLDDPPTPAAVRWPSLLVQTGLLAVVLWAVLRSGRARPGRRRALGFLLAAWLVPIAIPWGINHWRALFQTGRHDFYVLGTVCVLLAVGLGELLAAGREGAAAPRPRLRMGIAVAAIAILAVGAGHRLLWLHRTPALDKHRATGAWIAGHAGAGDRVIAMGIRRLVNEHYTRLGANPVAFASFPRSTDDHPGWSDVPTLLEDEEALHREARATVAELGRQLPADGAVILLLRPYVWTEGAASATWLVDRHMVENLIAAGWRRAPELESYELNIAAFRPPAASDRE